MNTTPPQRPDPEPGSAVGQGIAVTAPEFDQAFERLVDAVYTASHFLEATGHASASDELLNSLIEVERLIYP